MRKGLLFLVLLLCGLSVAFAQRTITGTVVNGSDNTSVPSASVIVKGARPMIGVTANLDGKFSIEVPDGYNTLRITSIGMKAEEVDISNTTNVTVTLNSETTDLETIVITGYGVSRRGSAVGASANVGEELITKQSSANVITNLQGTVPGVNISITSGSPGSSSPVQIRGMNSISGSTAPLYIIDGVPFQTGDFSLAGGQTVDPLSSFNPEDIANISFLKDAAATSIYGSRATGGVIVITTKKGETGKASINFNARVGINDKPYIRKNFRLLEREDYFEYLRTALRNGPRQPVDATDEQLNAYMKAFYKVDVNDPTNEDWWDAITRRGIIQDYSLSASGGSENSKYYISGNYFQDQGSIIGSGTKRFSVRLSLDNKLNKYITLENSLTGSFSSTDGLMGETYYANPIMAARMNMFYQPIRKKDGTWNFLTSANNQNPVARVEGDMPNIARTNLYKLIYTPTVRVQVLKDLFVQVKAGLDYTLSHGTTAMNPALDPDATTYGGLHEDIRYQALNVINTNTINWIPQFGKHGLNVLLGQEIFTESYDYVGAAAVNFASPKLIYAINNGVEPIGTNGYKDDMAMASVFSNVEYNYDDKYYFSASVRGDGSSRFIKRNRWGAFFSVGAKYRITQEDFMKATENWLQNLTLRVSYGTTGNQDIGGFHPAKGFYNFSSSYNGNPASYYGTSSVLHNPDLTWETSKKFNLGMDITMLDRITVELDYFYNIIDNMLFAVPISRTTGFTSIAKNLGAMRNTGIEGTLNFILVNKKDVNWTFNLNFSTVSNKILRMTPDSLKGNAVLHTAGLPWNTIWVANMEGISSDDGTPMYYLNMTGESSPDVVKAMLPGNRIIAGYSDAIIAGGFGTRVDFFGFDLSMQFVYSLGGVSFNDDGQQHEWSDGLNFKMPSNITYYAWEHSWKKEGQKDATLPAIKSSRPPDHFWALWTKQNLHNMSYLKLRNVTIGYTLPKKIVNKAKMTNLRIYFTCDNVFSIYHKSYRGYDTNPLGLAQDNSGFNYPISRNYLFGINVGF
jgi:TonB-linked SusC/RagA family outer membrane protein